MSKKARTTIKAYRDIPKEKLDAIVERLRSGASKLIRESKALGFADNTPLRAALRVHLGGAKPYRAMIERGMKARSKT